MVDGDVAQSTRDDGIHECERIDHAARVRAFAQRASHQVHGSSDALGTPKGTPHREADCC